MMGRFDLANQIQQLDPKQDAMKICHLLAGYEFPWDITRALELALLRTFCIPSVSALLDRTGEFQHYTQKRYDDTGIIVSELFKWGYEDPRGQGFLNRMNAIHAHFPIRNEDYLYVLSTFIYEPIRWCDRFGWRPFSDIEKQATFYFWQAIGERMGITDIPATYEKFEQYNRNHEQEYFQYAATNRRVADATRNMMVQWFPVPLQSIVNGFVPALLDPALLRALGWEMASPQRTAVAQTLLQIRSRCLRKLPPRKLPDFFVDQSLRSYPHGFELSDIGPLAMVDDLNEHK